MMQPVRFGVQIWSPLPVRKLVDQVCLAEELGYDSAWMIDSQLISPDIYVKLAACALHTKRITLGVGVTNPLTRNPTVTAGALAAVADLAPGRIHAALSLGGSSVTSIGLAPAKVSKLRADFRLIAGLLQGEQLGYNGKKIKLVWADPYITRQIRLSIVAHSPNGQQLAGELGCPLGVATELQRLDRCIALLETGARRAGRPAQAVRIRWSGQTSIADDWEIIKEHRLSQIATFIRERYRLYLRGGMAAEELPVDVDMARRVAEGYDWLEHASARASHARILLDYPDHEWRQWLKGQFIGKPEEVIQVLRGGLKHECIEEVVLGLHVSTERLSVEQNMKAFAMRVRPYL